MIPAPADGRCREEGTFHGIGDEFRSGDAVVFAVAPGTAYGFGRGTTGSTATRVGRSEPPRPLVIRPGPW